MRSCVMKQTVLIVGLGLIGSSLALNLKKHPSHPRILGWDYQEKTRILALKNKIIHEIPEDFETGVVQADLILLAVPVKIALCYLEQLKTLPVKENLLVTDVGSTKCEIMKSAETLPFDFIGGHPMAGSHKSGVLAADENLFENAYYIFTLPTINPGAFRLEELQALLSETRAKYVVLSAKEHDEITGMLSHLPHIIAASLVNEADRFNQTHPRSKQLAAGGFRDITRIASSDPQMWTDILLSNQDPLVRLLKNWQQNLERVIHWMQQDCEKEIYTFFEQAKATRDQLPIHENGAIPAFYDLFVDVPDEAGVIAKVTTILGEENLSITNLRILETREDIIGVLQLTFKTQQELLTGKKCIEEKTSFSCRIK